MRTTVNGKMVISGPRMVIVNGKRVIVGLPHKAVISNGRQIIVVR